MKTSCSRLLKSSGFSHCIPNEIQTSHHGQQDLMASRLCPPQLLTTCPGLPLCLPALSFQVELAGIFLCLEHRSPRPQSWAPGLGANVPFSEGPSLTPNQSRLPMLPQPHPCLFSSYHVPLFEIILSVYWTRDSVLLSRAP